MFVKPLLLIDNTQIRKPYAQRVHFTALLSISIRTRERSTADNLLYVPYVNCDQLKQSFEYRAPADWNSLPSHLRKVPSV